MGILNKKNLKSTLYFLTLVCLRLLRRFFIAILSLLVRFGAYPEKSKYLYFTYQWLIKNSGAWEIWIWSFWPWWRSGLWLAAIYSCIHTYYTSFLYTDLEVWCHRSQAELQNRSKKGIGVWLHSTRLTRFKICQDESGGWQIKSSTTSRLLLINYKNNIPTQGLDLCFKVIIAIKSSKHS